MSEIPYDAWWTRASWGRDRYVAANPMSEAGNPNVADRLGYDFVGYTQNGLLVYRLQPRRRRFARWVIFLLRSRI